MNDAEWNGFALELEASFRGEFGPADGNDVAGAAQEAAWRSHLGHLPLETATAALALLVADGKVFLPEPGEVVAAVQRITGAGPVPFAQALAGVVFLAKVNRPKRAPYSGPRRDVTPVEVDAASEQTAEVAFVAAVSETLGEGAARWAKARGRRALLGETLDGEHAGAARKRLEDEYSAFVAQADEDGKVGLALAHVQRRGLELPATSGPRKLNAAERLGLPVADVLEHEVRS